MWTEVTSRSLPRMALRLSGQSTSHVLGSLAASRGLNFRFYSEQAQVAPSPEARLGPGIVETPPASEASKSEAAEDDANGEKATQSLKYTTEKTVYVCLKGIFQGNNKTIRKSKTVQKVIESHRSDRHVNLLMRKYKMSALSKVTTQLLHDGIFDSSTKAKARFPDLNDAVFSKADGEQAAAAATAEAEALEALETVDDDALIAHGTTFTSDILEVAKASATSAPAETSENVTEPTAVVVTGPLAAPGPIVMPVLATPPPDSIEPPISTFLPMPAQHQLLTHLQQVLEVACFEFCKRTMPDLLEQNKWEYAESVELHRWMDEFLKRKSRFPETNKLTAKPLRQIFAIAADIRHTCVHRLPIETWRLNDFLSSAEALLSLLGDMLRADKVAKLRRMIHIVTEEVESSKRSQQRQSDDIMRRIATQRSELQLLEERTNLEMTRMAKDAEIHAGNKVLRLMAFSSVVRPERIFDWAPGLSLDEADELGLDGAEARVETRPEARTEVVTESKRTGAMAESKRTDAKADTKPEVRIVTKPEGRVETKAEANHKARIEAKPEVRAVTKPEARVKTKSEANHQARTETKPEARSEVKPVASNEVKPVTRSEVKPVARTEAKRETRIEAKPESRVDDQAKEGAASTSQKGEEEGAGDDVSVIIARIKAKLAQRKSVAAAAAAKAGLNEDAPSLVLATWGLEKSKGSDQSNKLKAQDESMKAQDDSAKAQMQQATEAREKEEEVTVGGKDTVTQLDQLSKVSESEPVDGTKNEAETRDGISEQEGEPSSKQEGEPSSTQENDPSPKQEVERSETTEVEKSEGTKKRWWLPSFLTPSLYK